MIMEFIIVIAVVALAGIFMTMKLARIFTAKGASCGCGASTGCAACAKRKSEAV
jgi:hypothetical protein